MILPSRFLDLSFFVLCLSRSPSLPLPIDLEVLSRSWLLDIELVLVPFLLLCLLPDLDSCSPSCSLFGRSCTKNTSLDPPRVLWRPEVSFAVPTAEI